MPNQSILRSISEVWTKKWGSTKRVLDLSCGSEETTRILSEIGFTAVATEFGLPSFLGDSIDRVGGVNLNKNLPFRDESFDGVNLVEVIEHVEHQVQLIREMARVVKTNGVIIVSTPTVLNVFSRLRFLFTGFIKGRARPLHYTVTPAMAHNIYLINFYELYYLLFHAACRDRRSGEDTGQVCQQVFCAICLSDDVDL